MECRESRFGVIAAQLEEAGGVLRGPDDGVTGGAKRDRVLDGEDVEQWGGWAREAAFGESQPPGAAVREDIHGDGVGDAEFGGGPDRKRAEEAAVGLPAGVDLILGHDADDGAGGGEVAPGDVGRDGDPGLEAE